MVWWLLLLLPAFAEAIKCVDGTTIVVVPGIPKEALCAEYGGYSLFQGSDDELAGLLRPDTPDDDELGARRAQFNKRGGRDWFKFSIWMEPYGFYQDGFDIAPGSSRVPYASAGIGFYGRVVYLNVGYSLYYDVLPTPSDPVQGPSLSMGVAAPFLFDRWRSFQMFTGLRAHVAEVHYAYDYLHYPLRGGLEVGVRASRNKVYLEAGVVPWAEELGRWTNDLAYGAYEPSEGPEIKDSFGRDGSGAFMKFGVSL
jgi:hypothetical protein